MRRKPKSIRADPDSDALEQAGLSRLFAVVFPGLCDPVLVSREADLEQLDLLRRDRLEWSEARRLDRAARILLHFEAVEKHLLDAVDGDHAAVAAQQTIFVPAERARHRGALLDGADVGRVRMNWHADEAEPEVAHGDDRAVHHGKQCRHRRVAMADRLYILARAIDAEMDRGLGRGQAVSVQNLAVEVD